jgi:hypothetical protein
MIIRNAGSLIQEGLDPGDGNQQHVTELLHAAERAMCLTQQLQAMGRSQLLQPDIVRPSEIVRSIRDMLRDIVPQVASLHQETVHARGARGARARAAGRARART